MRVEGRSLDGAGGVVTPKRYIMGTGAGVNNGHYFTTGGTETGAGTPVNCRLHDYREVGSNGSGLRPIPSTRLQTTPSGLSLVSRGLRLSATIGGTRGPGSGPVTLASRRHPDL
jgi:hypothetical protein